MILIIKMHFTVWGHPLDRIGIWKCCSVLEEGKTGVLGQKPLGARARTNNNLNPHMTPSEGIEPGPHWRKTSAPSLLPIFNGKLTLKLNSQNSILSKLITYYEIS